MEEGLANKIEDTFTLVNGEETETFKVLFTFTLQKFKKDYVVYTSDFSNNKNKEVMVNPYNIVNSETILGKVETDKEWEAIEYIIANHIQVK